MVSPPVLQLLSLLPLLSLVASSGGSAVVPICSKKGSYSDINGPAMSRARRKLENHRIFGPRGAVADLDFRFVDSLPDVNASSLTGCRVFFTGGADGLTSSEVIALGQWTKQDGHFLIGGCDSAGRDSACQAMVRRTSNDPCCLALFRQR
eukprot:COSAG05_NODE_3278_length_2183_cov_1.496161_1_plen_150_part_00